MFRRDVIDKKIVELRRALATTDDELTVALLMMAIESFESERAALVREANINDTRSGQLSAEILARRE
jgi:hypothetical protein